MARQPNQQVLTKKHLARLEKERIQQRYLLIGTIAIVVLIIGIILYGFLDQTVIKAARPVAKVGNETISTSAFQKEVRFQRYRLIDQLRGLAQDPMMLQFFSSYVQQIQTQLSTPTSIGQEVLDSQIEDILVRKEAEKRGITVTEEELDEAFETAFGFYPNGTQTPTITVTPFSTSTLSPTQEALFPPTKEPTATLEPTATTTPTESPVTPTPEPSGTPTSAFTATPSATATITPTPTAYTKDLFDKNVNDYVGTVEEISYTRNDLRALLRRQLLKQKVYDAITGEVPTSADQVWARHILVATEDEAKQALDRLSKGETFADLANELSTDTSNNGQGGDLSWFTKGKMVQPFEEAAWALNVGEISQPVQSTFGYHIIQVLGHEERPLDSSQLEEAKQKAYDEWLESAKTAANVVTYSETWTQVIPDEPAIPADIQAILIQLNTATQQLPTE